MIIYLIFERVIVEVSDTYHAIGGQIVYTPFDITAFPDSTYERLI